MTQTTVLVLAGALLLAVIVAFRRRREAVTLQPPDAGRGGDADDGIDWDELERAEREVQELEHDGAGGAPEESPGDDWGPGTPKPPSA